MLYYEQLLSCLEMFHVLQVYKELVQFRQFVTVRLAL